MGRRGVAGGLSVRGAVVAVLAAGIALARAAEPAGVSREADGIFAALRVDASGADIGWRFLHRPPAPVSSLDVTLNGRPMGAPDGVAPFPAVGQTAAIRCVVDRSDPAGAAAGQAADSAIAALRAALPHGVAITTASFGEAVSAEPGAAPQDVPPDPSPTGAPGDLVAAIRAGIQDLRAKPADRRALLVFTDGFVHGPLPADDLAARATAQDIALYFIIAPSLRLADLASLARLAQATRGALLDPGADLGPALSRTFLSGAQVRFPFGAAAPYVWERHTTVSAELAYGAQRLVLSVDADRPAAGWAVTLAALWRRGADRLVPFGAGLVIAALGWTAMRLRRASHRSG